MRKTNPKQKKPKQKKPKNKIEIEILCIKCIKDPYNRSHKSASYLNTTSLKKHIRRCHQIDKNISPTNEEVISVIDQIDEAQTKGTPLESIPKVLEWKIVIKKNNGKWKILGTEMC